MCRIADVEVIFPGKHPLDSRLHFLYFTELICQFLGGDPKSHELIAGLFAGAPPKFGFRQFVFQSVLQTLAQPIKLLQAFQGQVPSFFQMPWFQGDAVP